MVENRHPANPAQLVLLGPGETFAVTDAVPGTRFLLMTGQPYGEVPVFNGPYVDYDPFDRTPRGRLPTPPDLENFHLQGVSHVADIYLAMGTTRQQTAAQGSIPSVMSGASVPIEAASELMCVDVDQIRRWAAAGAVEIEHRGDLEVVRLDAVETLSQSRRTPGRDGRYMLRRLLDGARLETPSVVELQRIARERELVTAS